ncbi:MAG: hypothetical protein WAN36_14395 [Calditrichia bacterium]
MAALFLFSCSGGEKNKAVDDSPVVATVGSEKITAAEFRRDYELGFGHLKTGENKKKTYLNYMINEKLLAQKGYQLGLDESPAIKAAATELRQEAMIETLINQEVKSRIKVTPEEIREEINRAHVSFKLRYWPEPTLNQAQEVAQQMREKGYADVVDELISQIPERRIDPAKLTTDWLTNMDVSPKILAAVQELPYGDISEPVEINGRYYIFQVVDIKRRSITQNTYKAEASRYEQVIFYRKFKKALNNYISDLMAPKNIVTKRSSFDLLEAALREWQQTAPENREKFLQTVNNAGEDKPVLQKLRENMDQVFFTYIDGELTLREFLYYFEADRFLARRHDKEYFTRELHAAVKQTIRDYFMLQKARNMDLQDSPEVEQQLKMWRDKWVYDATRDYLTRNLSADSLQLRAYFEKHRQRYQTSQDSSVSFRQAISRVRSDFYREQAASELRPELRQLRKQYEVSINESVLDTISVTDFQKSRWAHFEILKSGSNRPAFPSVDPMWAPTGVSPDTAGTDLLLN